MTAKRILNDGTVPGNPPVDPLQGGRTAKRSHVHQVMFHQDRILPAGRREVLRVGLLGSDEFQVPADTDPDGTGSQIYPEAGVLREVTQAHIRLTPGYGLVLSILCLPSGPRQQFTDPLWDSDGIGGIVQLEVAFSLGIPTETVTRVFVLPNSQEEFAGEPAADGAAWDALELVQSSPIYFKDVDNDDSALEQWGGTGVEAQVRLYYMGSVRPVDIVLHEEPHVFGADETTDTNWPTHCYTDGDGKPEVQYPDPWPQQQRSEAPVDITHGTLQIADVARDQIDYLGPMIFSWSAYNESEADVAVADGETASIMSATWLGLHGIGGWSLSNPGWSGACGGSSARPFDESNPILALRDKTGAIPVVVKVRAKMADVGQVGYVRIWASSTNFLEVVVNTNTMINRTASGWLKCNTGPWDRTVWNLLARVSGAGQELLLQSVTVCYGEE